MEEINGDGVEHATYHVSPAGAKPCHGGDVQIAKGSARPLPTMATEWHEYAVEVALGRFAFVVDGAVLYNSTANASVPVHDGA